MTLLKVGEGTVILQEVLTGAVLGEAGSCGHSINDGVTAGYYLPESSARHISFIKLT